jgi:hypothetical protein
LKIAELFLNAFESLREMQERLVGEDTPSEEIEKELEAQASAEALRLFTVLDTWRLAFVGAEILAIPESEKQAVREASMRLERALVDPLLEDPGVFAPTYSFIAAHLDAFREDLLDRIPELAATVDIWQAVRSEVEDLPEVDLDSVRKK